MPQVPKDQILEMLTARGEDDRIEEATNQLPDPVDTEQHADLLAELGVDPADLDEAGGGGLKFGIDEDAGEAR
jgi:hypothetical protein